MRVPTLTGPHSIKAIFTKTISMKSGKMGFLLSEIANGPGKVNVQIAPYGEIAWETGCTIGTETSIPY